MCGGSGRHTNISGSERLTGRLSFEASGKRLSFNSVRFPALMHFHSSRSMSRYNWCQGVSFKAICYLWTAQVTCWDPLKGGRSFTTLQCRNEMKECCLSYLQCSTLHIFTLGEIYISFTSSNSVLNRALQQATGNNTRTTGRKWARPSSSRCGHVSLGPLGPNRLTLWPFMASSTEHWDMPWWTGRENVAATCSDQICLHCVADLYETWSVLLSSRLSNSRWRHL